MNVAWISMPGGAEMLVIVGVLVLLFGAKKIPQLARGIGSSFSEFKKGLREADELKQDLERPAAPPTSIRELVEAEELERAVERDLERLPAWQRPLVRARLEEIKERHAKEPARQ